MSMKHEYRVGDEVYIANTDIPSLQIIGEKVEIIEITGYQDLSRGINAEYRCLRSNGTKFYIREDYLSPYPPVKAVDGWAVVDATTKQIMSVHIGQWVEGFQNCIKVKIIPDNDNS